jgi:hypothetical protein
MGREVRMVPADWEHPKQGDGSYKALYEGYKEDSTEFMELASKKGLQKAVEYMGCPDKEDYMPDWSSDEKTHCMMYETTTEGTPISPAFTTTEELAQWLADTGASAFGSSTASYEGWLRVAKGGFAPSAVMSDKGIISGVDAL